MTSSQQNVRHMELVLTSFIICWLDQCLSPPLTMYLMNWEYLRHFSCGGSECTVLPGTITWLQRILPDAVDAIISVPWHFSSFPKTWTCLLPQRFHVWPGNGNRCIPVWLALMTSSGGVWWVWIEQAIQMAMFQPSSDQFLGVDLALCVATWYE